MDRLWKRHKPRGGKWRAFGVSNVSFYYPPALLGRMSMFSERFWSKVIKVLSDHGPNTLVFPLVFGVFLYALHAGVDPSLALAGLAITYGGFLWGQSSRQSHLERMAKVDVDKIVATRGSPGAMTPRSKTIGKAKSGA